MQTRSRSADPELATDLADIAAAFEDWKGAEIDVVIMEPGKAWRAAADAIS